MQQTFRPKKDPRPEMEQALERAIEISQGEKEYHIIDGRLTYEQPRQYHYSFTLESSWDLPDGADIQLKSADFDHLLVELLGTKDESIMIMTTQRLPASTLSHATLSIERAYLLRKMKEALFQGQGTGDLGLKLFGHLDCADEIADSSSVDLLREVFIPDDAQRLAIQRALDRQALRIVRNKHFAKKINRRGVCYFICTIEVPKELEAEIPCTLSLKQCFFHFAQ